MPALIAPTLLDLTRTSVNDSVPYVVRVADHPAAERDPPGAAVDQIVGLEHVLFERRRRGDDLERRSRLVEILDRAVAARVLADPPEAVRVERRVVGHRQDLAGVRDP